MNTRANQQQQIQVTLVRSLLGRPAAHQACARGLGLRRIRQTVRVDDTPNTRGMIRKIAYLLQVQQG
ncbi:MAG: 50S ribosomal protein L30 [Gammaproteobacteria bacterium]